MRLLKKINNNFALARDSSGKEVIVSGRGLGFMKMPCDLADMSLVSHTYYSLDERAISLIGKIQEEIIDVADKIVNTAKVTLNKKINPNLTFTLADHIQFAIVRSEQGIRFGTGIAYEIQFEYPDEYEIGEWAVRLINRDLNTKLPKEEASIITMHIAQSEMELIPVEKDSYEKNDAAIHEIIAIVENDMGIHSDPGSFDYYRFTTHMQFLLSRGKELKQKKTGNEKIFQEVKESYPDVYHCSLDIQQYIFDHFRWKMEDEEILYVMLHINRLCAREDCNH